MRTHWVMDYETLSNCFLGVFESVNSEEQHIFVVHESRNDIVELLKFFERNVSFDEWHVSFNGLSFDSQITEYIIRNKYELLDETAETVAKFIYAKAQAIITNQNENRFFCMASNPINIPWIRNSYKTY